MADIARFKRTARKPGSDEPIPVTPLGGHPEYAAEYAKAGVDRVLFWIRPVDRAAAVRVVDRIALTIGT